LLGKITGGRTRVQRHAFVRARVSTRRDYTRTGKKKRVRPTVKFFARSGGARLRHELTDRRRFWPSGMRGTFTWRTARIFPGPLITTIPGGAARRRDLLLPRYDGKIGRWKWNTCRPSSGKLTFPRIYAGFTEADLGMGIYLSVG